MVELRLPHSTCLAASFPQMHPQLVNVIQSIVINLSSLVCSYSFGSPATPVNLSILQRREKYYPSAD